MSGHDTNEEQAKYWTDVGGPNWVRNQSAFDLMLESFGAEALATLVLQPGERVVDIGCGFGTTTIALGATVGSSGRAHGIDISPVMIEAARGKAAALPQVSFAVADAQVDRLGDDEQLFDAAYSRFGVMFFGDPVGAFRNIADNVRSDGRLAFVCWQNEAVNPWVSLPAEVMRRFTPEPVMPAPNEPGPFAFEDGDRVRDLLEDAGWTDVDMTPFSTVSKVGGGGGVEPALAQALSTRAGAAMRAQVDDETFERVKVAVRAVLQEHLVDGAVQMPASAWVVTAKRP